MTTELLTEAELNEIRLCVRSWNGERDEDGYLVEGPEWDSEDIVRALGRLLASHDAWADAKETERDRPMSEPLPPGWHMVMPGYAVDHGRTASDGLVVAVVRWCDARGGIVQIGSVDGRGVPVGVVRACIEAASDFPPEFKP